MRSACARLALVALVASTICVGLVRADVSEDAQMTLDYDLDGPSVPGRLLRHLEMEPAETARDAISTIDRSLQSRISAVVLPRGDDACCKCVGHTAHHIIDETYGQVVQACSNVTCPIIQKECKWIEDHEERYKGFLVARIRPAALGFSYCMGTGDCAHPNYTRIDEIASSKTDPSYLEMQVETLVAKVVQASSNDTSKAERRQAMDFSDIDAETQTSEVAMGDDKDRRHRCLRRAVKWVMRHAIRSFIHHCKETKCPYEKKVCEFADKHRDLTHGYIYGKVEPWKFAIGYCAGRRHGERIAQE